MRPRSSSLLQHSALNIAGTTLPLLVALAVMPSIVHHLGRYRFGLLSLAWALLEYFSLMDLGLGRATTKIVAERIARLDPDLGSVVVISALSQFGLGAIGGLVLSAIAPLLLNHVARVPPELHAEALASLRILGLTLPFVLLGLTLRGVLEAARRFDLSNAIRIPSSSSTFLIPAIAAASGASLPEILLWMLGARLLTCTASALVLPWAVPTARWGWPRNWTSLRELLDFGRWVAVSNAVNPILIYFDRFALGSIAGVAAVGFYTAPYELALRLLILPASVATSLFPIVSASDVRSDRGALCRLFSLSVRNVALALAPFAVVLGVFAPDILRLWLGPSFAAQGAVALRILAIGVFANALAHIPNGYAQGMGRPDITAKAHLAELFLHVPLTWVLVSRFGISGAALAWTIRVTLDLAILARVSKTLLAISMADLVGARAVRVSACLLLLVVGALVSALSRMVPVLSVTTAALALVAFAVLVWNWVLDPQERAALLKGSTFSFRAPEMS